MASSITIPRRLPLLLVADNVLLPGSSMRIPVKSLRNMNMVKSRLLSRHTLSSTVIGVVPKNASEDETEELSTLHFIGTAAVVVQVTGTNWPRPAYTLLVTGLCRFRIEELLQETPYPVAAVRQLDMLPGDDKAMPHPSLAKLHPHLARVAIDQSLISLTINFQKTIQVFVGERANCLTTEFLQTTYSKGYIAGPDNGLSRKGELGMLAENFREQAAKLVEMLDVSIPVVAKLKKMLNSLPSQHLPDVCTSILKASYNEKLQILDAVDLLERFRKTLPLLMRQIEGLKLLQKARKENIEIVGQRDRGTRSSMRRLFNKETADIDAERDGADEEIDDMADLAQKVKAAQMPDHAHSVATKELKRLRKMGSHMPEYALIRNYLELMVELPWSKSSKDSLDIVQAREDLDTDHYGLEKLKKRVVEYLAVRQLKNNLKGPILCFVGPPGVGKTSVGRSIAHTLGREFHRISLGGVCDQSDIRGHRRTYIGAMPGRIIHGLKQVGVNNPVFLLDEVDKLGKSMHGDPAAALLEVLDPEQNNSFTDHYLNIHFDLSQVLFIATANNMSSIPAPLLDRMELIQIPGYTQEEKVHIASRHLVAKQLNEHGLTLDQLQIPDESLMILVSRYTREAGVRMLERKIAAVCRAVAVKVAESACKQVSLASDDEDKEDSTGDSSGGDDGKKPSRVKHVDGDTDTESGGQLATNLAHPPEMPIVIDEAAIEDILGPAQYECEMSERLKQPGIAVGLAWTAVGGQIMFVEATSMDGDGKLTLTGQLGDVMKESANLALNWVRSNSKQLGLSINTDPLAKRDLHIHFPAGSISKDGPSAGVTIATVLVSLFSDRCVRSDTAMTGEITLRGLVLPVGGIKEKVLAAHRAGIQRIILPKRNEKDLIDIPANVRTLLSFVFVTRLVDVLNAAFDAGFPALSSPVSSIPSKL